MSERSTRGGGAVLALLIALVVALAATALDFGVPRDGVHVLDRPGAAAAVGLAGAAAAVAIAHALRLVLGRRGENGDV